MHTKTAISSIGFHLKLTILCAGLLPNLLLSAGCVWRMPSVEQYWGPVLYRYAQPPNASAYVFEQKHLLPLVLEGGDQWGVSLGYTARLVAAPVSPTQKASFQLDQEGTGSACPVKTWCVSLFRLKATRLPQPQLIDRMNVGIRFGSGEEWTGVSGGVVYTTEQRPGADALSILSYAPGRPMDMVFTECPAGTEPMMTTCIKEESR